MCVCEYICVTLHDCEQLCKREHAYLRITHFFASEVAACIRKWERFSHENANAAAQRAVRAEIVCAITEAQAAKEVAVTEHRKAAVEKRMQEPIANIEFTLRVSYVLMLMR